MQIGYAISATQAQAAARPGPAFIARLTGLTAGEARQGTTIGVDVTGLSGSETLTYQWQQNGTDIAGATTATERVEIGTTHADNATLLCVVTVDGQPCPSDPATLRHAPGTLTIASPAAWTVDDTGVALDAAAAGAGLTFTHAASGLPAGVSIEPATGTIAGTPTEASSGTATVTATDQYGRVLQDGFTWSATLRARATAANALGPFDWTVDDDTTNTDATGDFTTNGNTLNYVIGGLPAGVADDGDGSISGSPTTDGQSGTVTVTATDEYGRETTSAFAYTTAYRALAIAADGLGPFSWTVDDTVVDVDGAADFTANGNTLTHAATGLPSGVSMAPGGAITGTPTAASSGTVIVTGTDEYGRVATSSTSHSTVLRTPASAAGTLPDRTFGVGTPVDLDLTGDFTANGNTLAYAIGGLPSGLGHDGDGSISGTPTTDGQTGSITITATDEYGRQVTSAFGYTTQADTLAVTDEGDGTISATWTGTLDSITVGGGGTFDGTYTTFHDGTALQDTHLDGVAGRALVVLDTTGTGEVGQTLTAGGHLVLHGQAGEPAVTIQWQRDGVDIVGATGTTYTLVADDAAARVRPTYLIGSAGLTTVAENGRAVDVAALATAPDAFLDADWSVATGAGERELAVTIAALPANNGTAVTDVEYDVDENGLWTPLPSYAGTGSYTIAMAAPATAYAIRLRAVNGNGPAAAGNSESATSGAAPAAGVAAYVTHGFEPNNTTSFTLPVDTSSFAAGERLFLFVSSEKAFQTMTVNGNDAGLAGGLPNFDNDTNNVRARKIWEYVLQAGDITAPGSTVDVVITHGKFVDNLGLTVLHSATGSLGPAAWSSSITPVTSTNTVILFVGGQPAPFLGGDVSYDNPDFTHVFTDTSVEAGMSMGFAENAPAGVEITTERTMPSAGTEHTRIIAVIE